MTYYQKVAQMLLEADAIHNYIDAECFSVIPKYIIKIVQEHDEGDQIRKHRKKRINKKWLKRYGCYGKQKLDKDQVIFVDGVAYMSRPHFKKLKKELSWKIN